MILEILKTAGLALGFAIAGVLATLVFVFAFRRKWTAIVVTIGLFVFGCEVYSNERLLKPDPEIRSQKWARYFAIADNSLSSFFMSRGSYDEFSEGKTKQREIPQAGSNSPQGGIGEPLINAYYTFHALCYAYGAAFLLFVFGRRISNVVAVAFRSYLWRVVELIPLIRKGANVVFWDICQESLEVADSMIRSCKKADRRYPVFVFREAKPFSLKREATPAETLLNDRRYSWMYIDPDVLCGLSSGALFRAREHYFLSPDGQQNVAIANQVIDRLPACAKCAKIFVRIDADADEDVLFEWAKKKQSLLTPPGEIILINEPSQVASALLKRYPMLESPGIEVDTNNCKVRGSFDVLLVGHGAQGKAMLREIVQSAVFPGAAISLSVMVVDNNEESFEPLKSFLDSSSVFIDNSNREDPTFPAQINFKKCDVHSGEFRKWIRESVEKSALHRKMPWNRVVFALPSDIDNLRLAQMFEREYRNAGIFDLQKCVPRIPLFFAGVRQRRNAKYSESITRENDRNGNLMATFGNMQNLYSRLRQRMEEDDNAAKFIEYYWCNGGKKHLKDYLADANRDNYWLNASFFFKESDRSFTHGTRTLAALLGNSSCLRALSYVEENNPDAWRRLAMTEHLRWNAFHLMRGVKPWKASAAELAALKKNMGIRDKIRPNDIKEGNRHAAIVPYDTLKNVAELFQDAGCFTDVDVSDANFVKSLPDVLELTDMKLSL